MTDIQKDLFDKLYIELDFLRDSLRKHCSNAKKVDDAYHRIVLRIAKNHRINTIDFAQDIADIVKFMRENN